MNKRFILIGLPNPRTPKDFILKDMQEVWALVESLGETQVVDALVQRATFPDRSTYIGPGKVHELFDKVKEKQADVVVINGIAKPGQLYNLQKKLYEANHNIEVWDRIDLILFIFSRHAATAEAKLQIELAKMRHMGPRIYGMGKVLSQQSAGIGTVGIGETNTELMKRHWRTQMKKVQDQLSKLTQDRQRQLERRRRVGLKTVSIVGYTNAGKTTLFNCLTGKHKKAANVLFATLDSAVGKLYLPHSKIEVLITDTIGFIKNLPPNLIEAFKSTLMESMHADVLVHVIDASDPDMEYKIFVVERILQELHAQNKEQLFVFNKIDVANGIDKKNIAAKYHEFSPLFISVKNGTGIDAVVNAIEVSSASLA